MPRLIKKKLIGIKNTHRIFNLLIEYYFVIKLAINQLKKQDPEVKILLNNFIIEDLKPVNNYFKSLTRNIMFQQLNGKAAQTILNRFLLLFPVTNYPTPKDILSVSNEDLRSAGISFPKANYLKNISRSFIEGKFDYNNINDYNDKEIIEQLIKIKGIGPWTAQMFLIFTLNRLDVFPIGDLGVQKGFQKYFKLENLPSSNEMLSRSEIWKPYRTIMTLYFWKLVDNS